MERGPIYGVELLTELPLDGGMMQALPSRDDLESIQDLRNGTRIVAGYEVLMEHYRRVKAALDANLCPECQAINEEDAWGEEAGP